MNAIDQDVSETIEGTLDHDEELQAWWLTSGKKCAAEDTNKN